MIVRVKAAGHLRQRMPGRQAEMEAELPSDSSALDLLGELGLSKSQVWIIRVNGENVEPQRTLSEGDFVELFPLVGGG